jgi:hypothetical protein
MNQKEGMYVLIPFSRRAALQTIKVMDFVMITITLPVVTGMTEIAVAQKSRRFSVMSALVVIALLNMKAVIVLIMWLELVVQKTLLEMDFVTMTTITQVATGTKVTAVELTIVSNIVLIVNA